MNDDLISREWLEDAFDNLCCHNCKTCRNFRMEDSFYRCALLDNAPTVEERPKGKWKEVDNGFGEPAHVCPKCGERALGKLVWFDTFEEVQSNFCPNCGADMRGDT